MRIRKKLWARPELQECYYYIQDPKHKKNRWEETFSKSNPIHLDLGCGKGVFLADIAYNNPDINYIGVDISVDILGVARRNIETRYGGDTVENIAIFSYNIESLPEVFSNTEGIERIYINFCNPWPKAKCHKKRLTYPRQLEIYKKLLNPGGEIWFKTDNDDLYIASKRYFKEAGFITVFDTTDLHAEKSAENTFTEHENMFTKQGIKTKAIRVLYEEEKNGGTA